MSLEDDARELAIMTLRLTDSLLANGVSLTTAAGTDLVSARITARHVLATTDEASEDDRRLMALRLERWGRLVRRESAQPPRKSAPGHPQR